MGQTFFPLEGYSETVPANESFHGKEVLYKISIGNEIWGSYPTPVLKVQIMEGGQVLGRKSPSYPIGSGDFERVQKKADELLKRFEKEIRKKS
ncbi:MAG TPA: hypothetical protein VGK71_05720 [Nitrospirota bacterium]|jgi:hypothetical protein